MDAVETGEAASLAILVRAGADLSVRNAKGQTALDIAEMEDNDECVEIMEAAPPRREASGSRGSGPHPASSERAGTASNKTGGGQSGGQRACAGCKVAKGKTEFSKN
eukprot:3940063-Rhodomonas_salina.1